MASLVESEGKVAADRPKIAQVIYNRLKVPMKLQIDATVIYARGGVRRPDGQVLFRDLEVDSPYNTYKITGLPPTPISAAGRTAISAALDPEPGPWLYYVKFQTDGTHKFSTTLAEHNAAIEGCQTPRRQSVVLGASGATRVAGVIGDPVRHSLSPAIHNAAFREAGLDWVFVAFPFAAGEARVALDGVRALGIDGLSVTMPHKEAVAGAVDRLTADGESGSAR